MQRALIDAQAGDAIARGAGCLDCKESLWRNGTHKTLYRTAFGRIQLTSPRFYACRCQGNQRTSRIPLSARLGSHISPELEYLEGQYAALLPYGVASRILNTVLPLESATSITSWHRRIGRIGERLDREALDPLAIEPQFNEFGLPKRRPLAHFLAEQGVDPTQPPTFLSDGGETVRIAPGNFRAFGEPILD